MSQPGYIWRKLTPRQRDELLTWRKDHQQPWHTPPHRPNFGHLNFHISAACYEHASFIGLSANRMDEFSASLMEVLGAHAQRTVCWSVLPNHYHALVETDNVLRLLRAGAFSWSDVARLERRGEHTWEAGFSWNHGTRHALGATFLGDSQLHPS
jgi:REP element-mobilizing transposase RayT